MSLLHSGPLDIYGSFLKSPKVKARLRTIRPVLDRW